MGTMCVPSKTLSLFKGLHLGIFGFHKKRVSGAKNCTMATAQKVPFCFFCDVQFWFGVLLHRHLNSIGEGYILLNLCMERDQNPSLSTFQHVLQVAECHW